MARSTFGGFGGDQVSLDPAGNSGFYKAAANYTTGTFWSASTGGTQYTDLIDAITSVALAGVSTDAHGHVVPFMGPDGITEGWLDFGGGRFKVTAIDTNIADAQVASNVNTTGSSTDVALKGRYAPQWKPSTAYAAGQQVISPNSDVVSAIAAHTSGTTFNAANWNLSTNLTARLQVTEAPLIPQRYGAVMDGTTDDTTAFTNMAAVANGATGRPEIRLLEGTYKTTAPINITRAGWTVGGYSRSAGSRITNSVTDVFTFAAGSAGSKHYFHDFRASGSAGHIFNVTNGSFYQNHMARLTLDQSGTGFSCFNQTSGDFLDNRFDVMDIMGTTGHTVPLWKVLSSTGGANENKFDRGRSTYSGNYAFWIEETGSGQYSNGNMWDGWNFETPNGGCIMGLSANGWVIRNTGVYDLSQFNSGATTKDLYVLGKSTGPASRYNKFERVIRHGGTLGSGLVDIKLQTGAAPLTRFEQCDLSSGSSGFVIDLGANSAISLVDLGGSVTVNNRGAQVYQNNGTSVAFFGKTPVAQAAAITSPTAPSATYVQAEAQAMKTAVDAIRTALANIGITA